MSSIFDFSYLRPLNESEQKLNKFADLLEANTQLYPVVNGRATWTIKDYSIHDHLC